MKWKVKIPKENDIRVIKRFLFFPRRIRKEVRWLETVYIKQKLGINDDCWVWKDLKFIDKKQ